MLWIRCCGEPLPRENLGGSAVIHVVDVVLTILEAVVDGIPQKPIEGTSFAYLRRGRRQPAPRLRLVPSGRRGCLQAAYSVLIRG
jgi:hypothetical protein